MSDFQLSVIVPFYKRDDYAIEIIKLIRTQAIECSIKTELLFVDADSRVYLDDDVDDDLCSTVCYES